MIDDGMFHFKNDDPKKGIEIFFYDKERKPIRVDVFSVERKKDRTTFHIKESND